MVEVVDVGAEQLEQQNVDITLQLSISLDFSIGQMPNRSVQSEDESPCFTGGLVMTGLRRSMLSLITS